MPAAIVVGALALAVERMHLTDKDGGRVTVTVTYEALTKAIIRIDYENTKSRPARITFQQGANAPLLLNPAAQEAGARTTGLLGWLLDLSTLQVELGTD